MSGRDRKRGYHGHYTTEISLEDVRAIFELREDQARPLGVRDIMDELGCSRRTAYAKLNKLHERGELETRKPSPNLRVWWISIPRDIAPLSEMGVTEVPIPSTIDEVLDVAGDIIPGRNEEIRRTRAETVLAAYEFVQRESTTTIKEIQKHVYDDAAVAELGSREKRWVNYLRDGLKELPGTVSPERTPVWHFIDPNGELAQLLEREITDEEWVTNPDKVPVVADEEIAHHQRVLVQEAYRYLQEEGTAQSSDFEEALPSYTANRKNFQGLWESLLRPALRNAPGVTVSGESGKYHYHDPDEE